MTAFNSIHPAFTLQFMLSFLIYLQYFIISEGKDVSIHSTAAQYYRGTDKSLAHSTSRCILFDGENISFDTSLVIHINRTNIPLIMIMNRTYEHQNLLSL